MNPLVKLLTEGGTRRIDDDFKYLYEVLNQMVASLENMFEITYKQRLSLTLIEYHAANRLSQDLQ